MAPGCGSVNCGEVGGLALADILMEHWAEIWSRLVQGLGQRGWSSQMKLHLMVESLQIYQGTELILVGTLVTGQHKHKGHNIHTCLGVLEYSQTKETRRGRPR